MSIRMYKCQSCPMTSNLLLYIVHLESVKGLRWANHFRHFKGYILVGPCLVNMYWCLTVVESRVKSISHNVFCSNLCQVAQRLADWKYQNFHTYDKPDKYQHQQSEDWLLFIFWQKPLRSVRLCHKHYKHYFWTMDAISHLKSEIPGVVCSFKKNVIAYVFTNAIY
jgi:hypothetical protein